MEYLEKNLDWLQEQLGEITKAPTKDRGRGQGEEREQKDVDQDAYVIFDCPGQVELFAMHGSFRRIVDALAKSLDFRFVCVHCVDVQLCSDENNYMAAVLLCLNIMLNLELPHVNVSPRASC